MYRFLQTYELHTFEEHISHEALQKLGSRNFCPDNPIKLQHRMSPEQLQINWLTVFFYS